MADGLRKGLTSYGDAGFSLFLRKAFIKAMGYSDDALNRPIVGITNTYSDYNPCHGNVPRIIEAVKRGVMLAGAMPMVFPTISIAESFSYPTSMYLRNLMAMDTEEMIRAQPMDAVVVIGGCDKTLPAQIMAAVSADLPTVVIPVGPMVVGHHKGEVLGACTDCRRLWARFRAGEIDEAEIEAVNGRLAPSVGTCMVMGTASTMACITEALGLSLPMSATAPATHADRRRIAEASGRLSGITLLERLGRTRVLVLGGLISCAGMLAAALAPVVWLALLGFAATGLGLANLFPAAMTRAGLLAGSGGVAMASTLGYTGFLLGPPLIGFLAGQFGLPAALTTVSVLGLAAAFVAYLTRDD